MDSQKAVVRLSWTLSGRSAMQTVTLATYGVLQGRVIGNAEFGAQVTDMHVDDVGLGVKMVVPDIFQQHGARDQLAGMLHQVFEQFELTRAQINSAAAARDLACQSVELQIGNGQAGV